jgi:hypothetical protein
MKDGTLYFGISLSFLPLGKPLAHPVPQRLQQSQGILPIFEREINAVGATAAKSDHYRSILCLISVNAHFSISSLSFMGLGPIPNLSPWNRAA